jgi:hypothetical protein
MDGDEGGPVLHLAAVRSAARLHRGRRRKGPGLGRAHAWRVRESSDGDAGQVLVNLGLIHRDGEWLPYWDGWISWMREQGWRRFGWYVWDQGSGIPGDWNGRLAPSFEFVWHFNRESVEPAKASGVQARWNSAWRQ